MYAMKFRYAVALVFLAVLSLGACGSGHPDIALSPVADEGRDLARSSGCSSCHGKNGQGVTAPTWKGLYQAITDPQALIRRDWSIRMPTNNLTDDEVASIIAYIKELQ